jgi:Tfp pilus assembly pilus retraction ATPase PilT
MNITESRLPQDGAIKTTLQDIDLDLRVSCLPTMNGEKVVIRILDYTMSEAGLESLGFSENNYEKIVKMINTPNGIILVTGATGTGKSTTVYSILQRLNKEDTNIITVEDPIEMNIEGINQVQTNSEIGLDFATALRSILRQDPNIIMIGEIRDTETAQIAIRASITGHLVLSTLHTNDALTTIERLLDMEVQRYLLASSLNGIISQKLARQLCPHCKKKRPTNDYEKELFKKIMNQDVDEIYYNDGCDKCSGGYSGRIAIHEVLLINQEIRDAISANIRKEKLRQLVYRNGTKTLLQDGLEKVLNGDTTLEELLKLVELDNDDEEGVMDIGNQIDTNHLENIQPINVFNPIMPMNPQMMAQMMPMNMRPPMQQPMAQPMPIQNQQPMTQQPMTQQPMTQQPIVQPSPVQQPIAHPTQDIPQSVQVPVPMMNNDGPLEFESIMDQEKTENEIDASNKQLDFLEDMLNNN